jgi:hypothetical protein
MSSEGGASNPGTPSGDFGPNYTPIRHSTVDRLVFLYAHRIKFLGNGKVESELNKR